MLKCEDRVGAKATRIPYYGIRATIIDPARPTTIRTVAAIGQARYTSTTRPTRRVSAQVPGEEPQRVVRLGPRQISVPARVGVQCLLG